MKINFSTMTDEERTSAFAGMDNTALTAALAEARGEVAPLFAKEPTDVTVDEANTAEALMASIGHIEAEQAQRAKTVKEASERFAAAKAQFSVNEGVESSDDGDDADDDDESDDDESDDDESDDGESDDGEDGDEGDESEVEAALSPEEKAKKEADAKKKGKKNPFEKTTTASGSQRLNKPTAASKVGRRTKRPALPSKPDMVITAAPDVAGFSAGQSLDGMEQVTKALLARVKGFAPHNLTAAKAVASQSNGQPVIHSFGVASFGMQTDESLTAPASESPNAEYATIQAAIKQRYDVSGNKADEGTMTAAGWCAPSETVYSYLADYVVDGLSPTPEVNAPRGGLNITTGPARSSQGTALDDFGWTQTEAQAEAGTVKPFETIVCPAFTDHRLDAVGYAYKIPLLTQKAYPELITDALRFASVLYAHRVNRRVINDKVALSTDLTFNGYGASFTDSLEAVAILATRERRKWNLGENAVMEVEAPIIAREVYRADMSRRTGLALTDVATDQKIAAEFAARHINVTYVSDWQEVSTSGKILLPDSFKIMVYPKGTFIRANEDVVNLSAIYDAASLSVNEYTGVFFEQGYMLAKAGYGSNLITIPINTAGETGAAIMTGLGDSHADGSF